MILFYLIIFYIFFIQATVNCGVANEELSAWPSVKDSKMEVIIRLSLTWYFLKTFFLQVNGGVAKEELSARPSIGVSKCRKNQFGCDANGEDQDQSDNKVNQELHGLLSEHHEFIEGKENYQEVQREITQNQKPPQVWNKVEKIRKFNTKTGNHELNNMCMPAADEDHALTPRSKVMNHLGSVLRKEIFSDINIFSFLEEEPCTQEKIESDMEEHEFIEVKKINQIIFFERTKKTDWKNKVF